MPESRLSYAFFRCSRLRSGKSSLATMPFLLRSNTDLAKCGTVNNSDGPMLCFVACKVFSRCDDSSGDNSLPL